MTKEIIDIINPVIIFIPSLKRGAKEKKNIDLWFRTDRIIWFGI